MIYDLGESGYDLELKAIPVNGHIDQLLPSVLNAFINNNRFDVQLFDIKLESQRKSDLTTLLFFAGSPKFKTSQQYSFFWRALEITLTRNLQLNRYELYFNNSRIKL